MIVKLIQCKVADKSKEHFFQAQCAWSALASVEGFIGQTGGWEAHDDCLAVIIAFWQDQQSYDRFMRDIHDPIFEKSGQANFYQSCEVHRWQAQFDIPGELHHLRDAISDGKLIRLAWCTVHPDRIEHFIQVQRAIWNPAMASAGGMLAGVFSRSDQDEHQFLVSTLWQSLAAHDDYRGRYLSKLRDQSEVNKDVAHLNGFVVHVQPDWRVVGQ